MSPAEYRAALSEAGILLTGASKFFQTDERTTRRWAADESGKDVPRAVAITLRLMAKFHLTSADVNELMNDAEEAGEG